MRSVALKVTHRFHAMGGRQEEVPSAAEITKALPPAVVHRVANDLQSGAVWDQLRREVGRSAGLIRRLRDDADLRVARRV